MSSASTISEHSVTDCQLNRYWLERGQDYLANDGYRLRKQFYKRQEELFIRELRPFNPSTLCEVGCGFGRLTNAIASAFPNARIYASDLSPQQLEHARQFCDGSNVSFTQRDLYIPEPFEACDVAVACEVFFHLPERVLRQTVDLLLGACRVVIHDFDPYLVPGTASGPHYFSHNYAEIYVSMGLRQVIVIEEGHGLMKIWKAAHS